MLSRSPLCFRCVSPIVLQISPMLLLTYEGQENTGHPLIVYGFRIVVIVSLGFPNDSHSSERVFCLVFPMWTYRSPRFHPITFMPCFVFRCLCSYGFPTFDFDVGS